MSHLSYTCLMSGWYWWSQARSRTLVLCRMPWQHTPEALMGFSHTAPITLPQLAQDLILLTFIMPSTDDIKTGLQPFMMMDGMEEHWANNMEVARDYGFLADGVMGISYQSLTALYAQETWSLPVMYFKLKKCLGMFGNLLAEVLGKLYPLTQSYWAFWTTFNKSMWKKVYDLIDHQAWLKPVHVLYQVHVEMHQWLNAKHMGSILMDPDFPTILGEIAQDKFVLPQLPYALYLTAYGGGRSTLASSLLLALGLVTSLPSCCNSPCRWSWHCKMLCHQEKNCTTCEMEK